MRHFQRSRLSLAEEDALRLRITELEAELARLKTPLPGPATWPDGTHNVRVCACSACVHWRSRQKTEG